MKLFGTLRELVAAVFRKDGHEITLRPNQTSSLYTTNRAVSLPQVDNDVVLTASGYIANADIAAAAGIVDTKLATISTAGKVSNSATTATDANTASAIVARDASGNFSAGTITASLSGNASTATTATSFSGSLSGEVTGTQSATVVASGVIDNDNISATAGIVDTKLATISTAGKVSNSATTATSANTASAIVARDGSGNFSAGTISASGVNVSGLTVSRAVVTDGSKNLASLEYTTADTGSTLMARDVAGSTSVNTLTAANIDVTGLATMNKAVIDGTTGDGFIDFVGQVAAPAVPPSAAARLFAGTDGKLYVRKTGSSQAEELGAGGSGEINLVDNSSDAGSWGVVNATATTNTTAANNPLSGTIDTSIAIASSTSGGYARYRFSMPSALKQRKLKLEWYQIASSLTSGAYKVEVWTNAASDYSGAYTELSLSTDSSGTSSIPNLNGKYSTTFDTNGSDYYEIRIVRTAASAATIYIANVVCGPGIQPQGAVVGEWQKYADADVALYGSTTNPTASYTRKDGYYRRVGDSLEIQLNYLVSAWSSGSGSLYVGLPAGLTIDGTKLKASGNSDGTVGTASWYDTSAGVTILCSVRVNTFSSVNRITLWANNTGGELQISQFGTDQLSVKCTVPIAEWAGSGTVQLAQNDVEYASNSSATTASDSTTFAYGPSGSLIQNFAPTGLNLIAKRVRFQTPIQVGDQVVVEVDEGTNGARWVNAVARIGSRGVNSAGTAAYGLNWVTINSTDVDVQFAATYDAAAADTWSTLNTWRWRVRKSSAGAAVGFGIVQPGVSAGLVSASGLPGNTTGNAIASGYVGERLRATGTGAIAGGANTTRGVGTLTIPSAGVWLLSGSCYAVWSGATGGNSHQLSSVGPGVGTFPEIGGSVGGVNDVTASTGSVANSTVMTFPTMVAAFSAPGTVYLNAYTVNNVSASSTIWSITAVRIA